MFCIHWIAENVGAEKEKMSEAEILFLCDNVTAVAGIAKGATKAGPLANAIILLINESLEKWNAHYYIVYIRTAWNISDPLTRPKRLAEDGTDKFSFFQIERNQKLIDTLEEKILLKLKIQEERHGEALREIEEENAKKGQNPKRMRQNEKEEKEEGKAQKVLCTRSGGVP